MLLVACSGPSPRSAASPAPSLPSGPSIPAPVQPSPEPSPQIAQKNQRPTPPSTPPAPAKVIQNQTAGVDLTLLTFDARTHHLSVVDQASPGKRFQTSKQVGTHLGALAVLNGGFFTPEGAPLGKLSANGETEGALNRSSLGSGFYLGGSSPRLITRSAFQRLSSLPPNFLQTGPRLVWSGDPTSSLKNERPRPRSFLLWDGKSRFALGHSSSATLAGLASALSKTDIFPVFHALNLDGGRSSDLWISPVVSGSEVVKRSFLNKPVRNYLVLKAR